MNLSRSTIRRGLDRVLMEVPDAATTMVAVLLSFASALIFKHIARLQDDFVVQMVAIAVTLARTQRDADFVSRLISLAVMPVVAVVGMETGSLMSQYPFIGDALFVTLMYLSIWIRRFGLLATRIGTFITLPLISVLIIQVPSIPTSELHIGWIAVGTFVTSAWVLVTQIFVNLITHVERKNRAVASKRRNTGTTSKPRLLVSTRMALQMGASLGFAFAIGHTAFAKHWTFVVLTAFIVCSGARSRSDVIYKGVLRSIGAALGTIIAAEMMQSFDVQGDVAVFWMFAILGLAVWLRSINYAYWAGCITAVVSLLYSYFGESASSLLLTRLEGICAGAAIGALACWTIFPIRTTDIVRFRTAEALGIIGDFLKAMMHGSPAELLHHQMRFKITIQQLDLLAPPLEAHRRFLHRRAERPHLADTIDVLRDIFQYIQSITALENKCGDILMPPDLSHLCANLYDRIAEIRLSIAKNQASLQPSIRASEPPPAKSERDIETSSYHSDMRSAVVEIHKAVMALRDVFSTKP